MSNWWVESKVAYFPFRDTIQYGQVSISLLSSLSQFYHNLRCFWRQHPKRQANIFLRFVFTHIKNSASKGCRTFPAECLYWDGMPRLNVIACREERSDSREKNSKVASGVVLHLLSYLLNVSISLWGTLNPAMVPSDLLVMHEINFIENNGHFTSIVRKGISPPRP